MTEREQMQQVCRRNGELACESLRLQAEVRHLLEINAKVCLEREATDIVLGEAMKELQRRRFS